MMNINNNNGITSPNTIQKLPSKFSLAGLKEALDSNFLNNTSKAKYITKFLDEMRDRIDDKDAQFIHTVFATLIAKHIASEVEENPEYKILIDDLATMIQQVVSLFIIPNQESKENDSVGSKQASYQKTLINELFKDIKGKIEFTNEPGEYDPDNHSSADWFYMFRNFAYDKKGEGGRLISKTGQRDYLSNTSPFYNLSLTMSLLYSKHKIPVKGVDHMGKSTLTSPLEDLLTKGFLREYLEKVNYPVREWVSGKNPQATSAYFGPFFDTDHSRLPLSLSVKQNSLKDFFQDESWLNGHRNYKLKENVPFGEEALKLGFQMFAGMSGTTAGILCAYTRLQYITNYLNSDGASQKIPINRSSTEKDFLLLAHSLYAWMVLAGDHHPDEVVFSYNFMRLYCLNHLGEFGELASTSKENIDELINQVKNQKNFYSDFIADLIANKNFSDKLVSDVRDWFKDTAAR